MELIGSHLLLNLPQITENARVGPYSTMSLGEKRNVAYKGKRACPTQHFTLKKKKYCDSLIFLEKGMATHSSILALENSVDEEAWWATVHGVRVRHN